MKLFSAFLAIAAAQGTAPVLKPGVCNLFDVTCGVDAGWTITVNETCYANEYKHLHIKKRASSFFILNYSAQGNPGTILPDTGCSFQYNATEYPVVKKNLPFSACGEFPFTVEDDKDVSVYTGYIDQREYLPDGKGGFVSTSELDEIKVECRLQNVDVSSENADISPPGELDSIDTLSSDQLIKDFGLGLEVGRYTQVGSAYVFVPLTPGEKVDVGSTITTRLKNKQGTSYVFQLKGCYGYAELGTPVTKNEVAFYTERNDYCPNQSVKDIINLVWNDFTENTLDVFRIKNANKLTFACLVTVFPANKEGERTNCTVTPPTVAPPGRRRRSAEEIVSSVEIIKTIDLAEDGQSGALQTCANFLVSFIFFVAFL